MSRAPQKIELVFYNNALGGEPVREWLLGLNVDNRHAIGMDLQRVQYRWPVGMPLVRSLGKGLFEVRTNLPDKRIARVLFSFHGGELFVLHGFIKKTQRMPPADLKIARQRQREVENG
jgi:phage-related protein